MKYVWVVGQREIDVDRCWRNVYFKQFERGQRVQTPLVSEAYKFKTLDAVFEFIKTNPKYADFCVIQKFTNEYLDSVANTIEELHLCYAYSKKPGWLVYEGDER